PGQTQETGLYGAIQRKLAWDAPENQQAVNTPLRFLICPAHAGGLPMAASTYYLGLAGVGKDAAQLPLASPDAGMFGYERVVHREDLEEPASRGMNTTALVAESDSDIGFWAEGGPATVRGLDPAIRPYSGPGRPFGGLHAGVTNVLFVSGSVDAIADDVDPVVFQNMLRIHAPVAAKGK
ncbi:MAG TPA: hypothetical protein VFA18_17360, partial [Gemmataceae bacterium]|nr:hypothetical protein [Gemmataceae bacterium]